jgi:hypothetical protein
VVELALRYHAYENLSERWVDIIPFSQWNLNNANSTATQVLSHESLFGTSNQERSKLEELQTNQRRCL